MRFVSRRPISALLALLALIFLLSAPSSADDVCHPDDAQCAPSSSDSPSYSTTATSMLSFLPSLSFLKSANSIPLSYILDMAKLLLPNFSWASAFCNSVIRNCQDKKDFPGPSYSQIGYDKVKELISKMPENEWSGAWWRGNELGTLINNPFFYYVLQNNSDRPLIDPLSIGLGMAPSQHAIIRPMLERMFTVTAERFPAFQQLVQESVEALLAECKEKGQITASDLQVWFHKFINKYVFDREVSTEYSLEFYKVQGSFLSAQLATQALPASLYSRDLFSMSTTREKLANYVREYRDLLKLQYSDYLEDKDCSPSVSCYDQAAFGILDAFVSAGGVSVPGTTSQALAVLYSTSSTNPAGAPFDYDPKTQSSQLIWEVVRIFPPVVVFPYWEPRPVCPGLSAEQTLNLQKPEGKSRPCPLGTPNPQTGFPTVNQYEGGKRFLPNVAMAQQDPDVWGEDALKFRLRPLELYEEKSLGFAEAAVNPNVANGGMDRSCPGRTLGLAMGATFLKNFVKEEWIVDESKEIRIKLGGPYVGSFTVYLKAKAEKCILENCDSCSPDASFLKSLSCASCKTSKCFV